MNTLTLARAIEQAEYFAHSARLLLDDLVQSGETVVHVGTRRSGEVRRRSLDLTRALADLRNPNKP